MVILSDASLNSALLIHDHMKVRWVTPCCGTKKPQPIIDRAVLHAKKTIQPITNQENKGHWNRVEKSLEYICIYIYTYLHTSTPLIEYLSILYTYQFYMYLIPINPWHIHGVERHIHLRPVGSWSQWAQSMRNLTGDSLGIKSVKQSLNVGWKHVKTRTVCFFFRFVKPNKWMQWHIWYLSIDIVENHSGFTMENAGMDWVWQARRTHVVLAMAFHAACENPQGLGDETR